MTIARNLIDGQWQEALSGNTVPSINPATGESLGSVVNGGKAEAEAAVQAARTAFSKASWSQNPRLRQMTLLRWADNLERNAGALAELLTKTNGKVLVQSQGEIAGAISEIRYYAGLTRHLTGHNLEVAPGEFSVMMREPAGVAGLIIPWNAPAVLLIRSLAPALAAGCTTVVKLATQTALFTARLVEHLHSVEEMPAGVVNTLHETGSEGAQFLVESPNVDVISFTGSTAVGKKIMAAAADTVKKLSLELGGKAAAIVLADASIDDAARHLAHAATIISGQQCTAARRVLIHDSRFEEMADALTGALSSLKVANGMDDGAHMGPLVDACARDAVADATARAFDQAEKVLLRGGVPDGAPQGSAFLTPSLVTSENPDAFFVQEEIFGPFVVLERFESEADAVEKANNTVFGLSASIWTNAGAPALRIARALHRGTVWINDHNKLFAEAETGGYRQSGLGRLHGFDALQDFTELKHVYQNVGVIGAR
ncbi:MAG: aldehyde dehydrogenase family protein [Nitratireductor sp.]|nr:aldehyde dehydrogenase family protein [Nitratireductor sp.]